MNICVPTHTQSFQKDLIEGGGWACSLQRRGPSVIALLNVEILVEDHFKGSPACPLDHGFIPLQELFQFRDHKSGFGTNPERSRRITAARHIRFLGKCFCPIEQVELREIPDRLIHSCYLYTPGRSPTAGSPCPRRETDQTPTCLFD